MLCVCSLILLYQSLTVTQLAMSANKFYVTRGITTGALRAVNRYVLITNSPWTYLSIYQKRHTEFMIIASWLSALGFLLPWITSSQYPHEGCSYLPASAASLLKGEKPILSDPFEAGTLVLTIIGQTMVVFYCYFKIF
uniref:G-protein coupled receptors family 1 profile domain-containing protein n=1 Tax=Hucho hucho TaxID=62062 RepID=A0A4W5RTI5_9TELE